MSEVLVILIGVALNFVPADATTLNIQVERGQIRLEKQADGGWNMGGGPINFSADHAEVTINAGGEAQKLDFAKRAGIPENSDWTKLKEIRLRGTPAQIERKDNGLDVVRKAEGDEAAPQTFRVRWEPVAKKSGEKRAPNPVSVQGSK